MSGSSFETVQKLQGSQAAEATAGVLAKFETVQKLQGSQAGSYPARASSRFETVQKLQGSQAALDPCRYRCSLRLYRNYKVLKPVIPCNT